MASLFKKNANYYLSFSNSQRRPRCNQISLKTPHKQIAERRARKYIYQYEIGDFDPWKKAESQSIPGLLGDSVSAFISTRSNLSEQSIAKYKSVLGLIVSFVGDDRIVSSITTDEIIDFLNSTKSLRNLSPECIWPQVRISLCNSDR